LQNKGTEWTIEPVISLSSEFIQFSALSKIADLSKELVKDLLLNPKPAESTGTGYYLVQSNEHPLSPYSEHSEIN